MTENDLLNTIDNKFSGFRHHNGTGVSEFSATSIRNIILGLDAKPNPQIRELVDKYYNTSIQLNPYLAKRTKRNYRMAIKHLRRFFIPA